MLDIKSHYWQVSQQMMANDMKNGWTHWVEEMVKQLSFIKLEVRNIFTGVVHVDSQVQIDWDSKSCFAADILSDNFVSASESWGKTLARWGCGTILLLFSVEDEWCLIILQ